MKLDPRRSLRGRIVVAFVGLGLLLGPLLAGAIFFLSHLSEERIVASGLHEYLDEITSSPHEYALRRPATAPQTQVLTNLRMDHLPAELFELPDGLHEWEADGQVWAIALRTTPEGRFAVIEDISLMEARERAGVIAVGVGALLTLYLALFLSFSLANRLLSPLLTLSERLARQRRGEPVPTFAEGIKDDEIGALARALDRYRSDVSDGLERERAFSADVSHELRNPLSVILNAAELIELDRQTTPRQREAATRIQLAARRMHDTVEVLLLIARRASTRHQEERIEINQVVTELLDEFAPLAERRGIDLARCYQANLQVVAPRIAVLTLLSNLIGNALEHSGATKVTITLRDTEVEIADNGCGLPTNLPFADPRTATDRCTPNSQSANDGKGDGGRGLLLVRRLCEHFGWTIRIDSPPSIGVRAVWGISSNHHQNGGE
ncbi:hypothetical protein CKO15_00990 [Halorhodospira abdelmalekii]|uniref:sensor histidine kinase n=1 Tax=Halorhodospira abdelmalekii TaxID=421629 RepID=UPI001906FAD8|nr:HAMP domain-containing sensor histidine kinase [Halorhodospira abdelmalekii]MBK1733876.1 hypothetical protein [Halorhodospira abdelmalekii]